MSDNSGIHQAAQAILDADALLIAAGAGMGVDSGLPDFRGSKGFWRAYPPYQQLGLSFEDVANPRWFSRDPALAWGFYGHRFQLYRATPPHAGFAILKKWAERMKHGAFVFTSNVDGHFQRAEFPEERIAECHGSINWLQCTRCHSRNIWAVEPSVSTLIELDETSMRACQPYPTCPDCGELARPNILMFGDWQWESKRTREQESHLESWLHDVDGMRLAIVECGAGTAIPTVRHFCERAATAANATLIRINVRDSDVPSGNIGLAMGALTGLQKIDACMLQRGSKD